MKTRRSESKGRNFDIRKNVLQFDDVMNKQRELIYSQRRDILKGDNMRETVIGMIHNMVDATAERNFTGDGSYDWSLDDAQEYLEKLCLKPGDIMKHKELLETVEEAEEFTELLKQGRRGVLRGAREDAFGAGY